MAKLKSSRAKPKRTLAAVPTSKLSYFFALFCLFVVIYVSLEPFRGWGAPQRDMLETFLNAAKQKRWWSFDLVINLAAYVPLGFALARATKHRVFSIVFASLISLALECAQYYLPTRQSSVLDWLANTCGAILGVLAAFAYSHSVRLTPAMQRWRQSILPGARGDYGLALLCIFLFAHSNPGLPLFGSTFLLSPGAVVEPGLALLQTLQTILNIIGVGLFADLVMRERLQGGGLMIAVLLTAIVSKTYLASVLIKPEQWGQWLSTSVALGLVLGATILMFLFWLRASVKRLICNISILAALLLPMLAPDWLLASVPLRVFDWNYGHLLNFNYLSQTLLRLWPLLASVYLIATAGNAFQDGSRESKA